MCSTEVQQEYKSHDFLATRGLLLPNAYDDTIITTNNIFLLAQL